MLLIDELKWNLSQLWCLEVEPFGLDCQSGIPCLTHDGFVRRDFVESTGRTCSLGLCFLAHTMMGLLLSVLQPHPKLEPMGPPSTGL